MTNKKEFCEYWERCSAPLCPEDEELEEGIWFPDEEICRARSKSSLQWIRNQRKIAKVADPEICGYFIYSELNRKIRVAKKIKGNDPERVYTGKSNIRGYSKHVLICEKTPFSSCGENQEILESYISMAPCVKDEEIGGGENEPY